MKRFLMTVALDVCLLAAAADAVAAGQDYPVSPATAPIVIDGRLDEPAWEQAVCDQTCPTSIFPATTARRRPRRCAASPTTPLACWWAVAPPIPTREQSGHARLSKHNIATLADRDAPRDDDSVGFLVDPFNDGRRAFQFRVNARGVQMDAMRSDVEGTDDWSWDAIWDARAQVTPEGLSLLNSACPSVRSGFPAPDCRRPGVFMATREMPRSTSPSHAVGAGRPGTRLPGLPVRHDQRPGQHHAGTQPRVRSDGQLFARTDVRA